MSAVQAQEDCKKRTTATTRARRGEALRTRDFNGAHTSLVARACHAAALRASLDGFRAQNVVEARRSVRELAAVLRAQGDEAGAAEAEASVA